MLTCKVVECRHTVSGMIPVIHPSQPTLIWVVVYTSDLGETRVDYASSARGRYDAMVLKTLVFERVRRKALRRGKALEQSTMRKESRTCPGLRSADVLPWLSSSSSAL